MSRFVLSIVLSMVAMCLWPTVLSGAQGTDGNLLSNGDFEESVWYFQDGILEVKVPHGWWAYWREYPPPELPVPANCVETPRPDCYWARPEFKPVEFASRVHSGSSAAMYFTVGRMHAAGWLQRVEDLPEGSQVRFSVWMMGWQCYDPQSCRGGRLSDAPAHLHLQVGIDPNGGWDAWAPAVIWSEPREAFDEWQLFQVEAQLSPGNRNVTVFTRSQAEWEWARTNNDVYVDDARLDIVRLPADVIPARLVSHTVAAGESLLTIAVQYGVTPDAIVQANAFPPNFRLEPGLVIWVPASGQRVTPGAPVPIATWPVETPTPAAGEQPGEQADVIGSFFALVLALLVFAGFSLLVRRYVGGR